MTLHLTAGVLISNHMSLPKRNERVHSASILFSSLLYSIICFSSTPPQAFQQFMYAVSHYFQMKEMQLVYHKRV